MLKKVPERENGGGGLGARLRVVTKAVKENKVPIVVILIAVVVVVVTNW